MNCRSEVLEVTVEARQVEEAMLALLHTILLHRSTGKFHYKKEGTYSIGTVGTLDIDCDFIDFTFVRVSSEELDRVIRKAVSEFKVIAGFSVIVDCDAQTGPQVTFSSCVYVTGRPEQLWQRWHGANLPGVLPEEEVSLAVF